MMRTTFNLQRLGVLQRRRSKEENVPPLVTCRDVLDFATLQGARCANLDHKVGTLTPGKEADILMLRVDRLDLWPLNNAASVVANFMNPVMWRVCSSQASRRNGAAPCGRRRRAGAAARAGCSSRVVTT